MLVHTAVPEKWSDNEDLWPQELKFNLVGLPSVKKLRKNHHSPRDISSASPKSPPKILNNGLKRKILHEAFDATEQEDYIDEFGESAGSSNNIYDDGPTLPAKRTYKAGLVVKQKNKSPKTIMNYIKQNTSNEIKDEETFFLTEEGNISSSDAKVEKRLSQSGGGGKSSTSNRPSSTTASTTTSVQQNSSIENYSEFIFGNEIYVQMPKRIFEEEKEKLRVETLKYKNMLLKLKNQIDTCIEI
jgi:hypothetical protein